MEIIIPISIATSLRSIFLILATTHISFFFLRLYTFLFIYQPSI